MINLSRALYLVLFFLSLAATVGAADTWSSIASRFGCTIKIHEGEQASGQYLIEFLPKGQNIDSHDRIFTIILVQVSQEDQAASGQVDAVIRSISRKFTQAGARVTQAERYSTNHGSVAFFDFVINGEHDLSVVSLTSPGILAVYQLATLHGIPPSAEDRQGLRALIGL